MELLLLPGEVKDLLLGHEIEGTIHFHPLEFLQPLYTFLDGCKVGEHATEPAVRYKGHTAAVCLFDYSWLCLTLCTDEQDGTVALCQFLYDIVGALELGNGSLQVNDMNAVSFGEYVGFHPRVPPACLMTKMNPSFEKLFHGYNRQFLLSSC